MPGQGEGLGHRDGAKSEGPEPSSVGAPTLDPMREAGEPSAWVQQCAVRSVVPDPPGIAMVAPPTVPRNAEGAQSERPRCLTRGGEDNAANNTRIIKAEVLHPAPLQRGSLILREDCYNVVTRASTPWVTTLCCTRQQAREGSACSLCSSGYSQRWRW